MGVQEPCGLGEAVDPQRVADIDALWTDCERNNKVLIEKLQEDAFSDALMKLTVEGAGMGRMTMLVPGTVSLFFVHTFHLMVLHSERM